MIIEMTWFVNTKKLFQSNNILDYYEKLQKCKNYIFGLQK